MGVICTQVLFIPVKRQVLQFQSVTLGLFPRVGYANKPDKIAYVRDLASTLELQHGHSHRPIGKQCSDMFYSMVLLGCTFCIHPFYQIITQYNHKYNS